MEKKELYEKFINDLQVIVDLYGEDAVEFALKDAYEQIQPSAMMEAKSGFLNESFLEWGRRVFGGLAKGAGATGRGGGRMLGRAIGRELDQDVWISGQDDPLEVKSDAMADLLKQTNELVQKTNELLGQLGSAIELSNESLGEVEFSVDDAVSAITGKSVADVRSRQSSYRSPEAEAASPGPEKIEEPLDSERAPPRV